MTNEWRQRNSWWLWCVWAGLALSTIVFGIGWLAYDPQQTLTLPSQNLSPDMKMQINLEPAGRPTRPTTLQATSTTTIQSSTTSTTTTSSTTYPPLTLPNVISVSGGDYYSTKPAQIDQKWRQCNPFENVTYEVENIISYGNDTYYTYNFTYLNGTVELRNRTELKTKTIKGGCIVVSANCCRCADGGTASAINVKYYKKYYEEVLNSCQVKKVICPMIMRSKIGCHPAVTCLNGLCSVVNR